MSLRCVSRLLKKFKYEKKAISYFFIILFIFTACNRDNQRVQVQTIVKEWTGKTIEIPEGIDSYFMNKDSLAPQYEAFYKMFVYTDSTGCTRCTLNLQALKHYIKEADSLGGDKLNFVFYFQPKDEKELQFLI